MFYSILSVVLLGAASIHAFAPLRNPSLCTISARCNDDGRALRSYLESLEQVERNDPSTFGELLSDGGGMNDPCAFAAASSSISSSIASKGYVTAEQVQSEIALANRVVKMVRHHFPGSLGSNEILGRVKGVLGDMGVENILLTQSVCPDEINHEPGDLTNLFIQYIGGGKVFHLGGLAGVPFTGRTGFGAFSAHVAKNGHCFVLQAPHIGLSDELEFGKYSREGQASSGSACGAAVGAMCHCVAGNPIPDLAAFADDYQMTYLISEISKRMNVLSPLSADNNAQQAELARQTHSIGKNMLDEIVSIDFGDDNSMLFVMSGIQINMPFDFEDYFQPLSFEVQKKDGSVVDLFAQTFGYQKS